MEADTFTDSDFIMFVDSDCIFFTFNTPDTYFKDGNPIMLVTPYDQVGKAICWKPITEKALGITCPFETMRRHPSMWHRSTIQGCREHMVKIAKKPNIRRTVMESGGFSEFNALGSWALRFQPDLYTVIDTTRNELPPEVLRQHWSYSRINDDERKWINETLG